MSMLKKPTDVPGTEGGVSRRDVLRLGGAGSLVAVMGGVTSGCGESSSDSASASKPSVSGQTQKTKTPRNVIMMVSDGMSAGVLSLAEPFAQLTRGRGTQWHELLQNKQATHGHLATRSLNSMVTDSSAASSAWGSGSRVNNRSLNMLPDGTKLVPIATLLSNNGQRVGLVTTDVAVGGTPSGFAAVAPVRDEYDDIARQLQGSVDVLMGGGRRFFDPLQRDDHQDLIGLYQSDGYQFVTKRHAVQGSPSKGTKRVLGLFQNMQMPYTIDHINQEKLRTEVPTLSEMTRYALQVLSQNRDGFFLMVEGARIDHACHTNDAAAMMWEQLAFDDALGTALQFAQDRDDTLVIATSDHGNANPGLCGMGKGYTGSTQCFEKLKPAKASFGRLHGKVIASAKANDIAMVRHEVEKLLGIDLSPEETRAVTRAMATNQLDGEIWHQERNWKGALGQAIANHTGVSFNGTTHTSDHVILSAIGPGAEQFAGLTQHPEVFTILTNFYGIDHVNPSVASKTADALIGEMSLSAPAMV